MNPTNGAPGPGPTALRTLGRVLRKAAPVLGYSLVPVLLLVFFVVPGPVISTSSAIGAEMAFAAVNGRDAVVLAYEATGFAGVRGGTERRVTAVDLATGDTLWDRPLPDGHHLPEVVAAGRSLAHVRSGAGLDIVSLADGEVVAEAESVEGLGADRYVGVGAAGAYRYDRARNAIVTVTAAGQVRAVPLDGTAAAPADADLTDTWSCLLGRSGAAPADYDGTAETAALPGGRTVALARPVGRPRGLPLLRLHERGPGDRTHRELSATDFAEPGFLVDHTPVEPRRRACPGRAPHEDVHPGGRPHTARTAVLASGHAVILSRTDLNADTRSLTVVDLATGEPTATAGIDGGVVRAMTAPSGQLVVAASTELHGRLNFPITTPTADVLFIADERGGLRRVVVGERGWFGRIGG